MEVSARRLMTINDHTWRSRIAIMRGRHLLPTGVQPGLRAPDPQPQTSAREFDRECAKKAKMRLGEIEKALEALRDSTPPIGKGLPAN